VNLWVRDGELVASPVTPRFALRALLAGVRPDNRHGEVDLGPPAGREVW
jgi:antitoxin component of MazEF toxin-antitoxin module